MVGLKMRRDELLERICDIWLKVTSEKVAVLVEGRNDKIAIKELPSIIEPEIIETQVHKLEIIVRKLKRRGVKRVLILSDFDRKGVIINKRLENFLKREGFVVLEHERNKLWFLLHQLKINHVEEIKRLSHIIKERLPFFIYYKKYCSKSMDNQIH